ncbi:MAG: 4Fe-4S binding protein [Burkholderiaceae bacterium]|nr:4Fe-4S binding protein [Burkholderiaceae bacterium]
MQESNLGHFRRPRLLARMGDALRQHQRLIAGVQWTVVALYLFFLLVPLFMPLPQEDARILGSLQRFAQFLFWGVGWPLIMVSMLLVGRAWCGLFCPDGTMTEAISKHGRNGSIPRWMRWPGWPCMMLVATTVYGQMVGVYDFHPATLLLLGLPTLGALLTGFLYGRGRRIWCMYLCPANGVFALLSKLAPLHFRVDEAQWKAYRGTPFRLVCPPLIDVRRMQRMSDCHACGRCSGYRDAVELAARAPQSEILATHNVGTAEAVTLLFGILGVGMLAMTWHGSRWFALFQSVLASLLRQDWLAVLQQYAAPWWLLVNCPQANTVFTLFDGLCLLLLLLAGGCLLALALWLPVQLAVAIAAHAGLAWQRLSLALVPVAGVSLVLGLSLFTVKHLRAEGLALTWLPQVQAGLLLVGGLSSLWLAWRMLAVTTVARRLPALAVFVLPVAAIGAIWLERLS